MCTTSTRLPRQHSCGASPNASGASCTEGGSSTKCHCLQSALVNCGAIKPPELNGKARPRQGSSTVDRAAVCEWGGEGDGAPLLHGRVRRINVVNKGFENTRNVVN